MVVAALNINDIIKQLTAAQDKANAANEKRYTEGLDVLSKGKTSMQDLYKKALDLSANTTAGEMTDVSMGATRAYGQGMQNLISSGLGNTTITGNLGRGIEEDRQRAGQRVQDAASLRQMGVATGQAGAEMGAAGQTADFIAARNDTGPNLGIYGALLQAAIGGQQGSGTNSQGVTQTQMDRLNSWGGPSAWAAEGRAAAAGGGGGGGTIDNGNSGGGGGGGGGSTGGGGGGVGGAPMTGMTQGSLPPGQGYSGPSSTFFGAGGASGSVTAEGAPASGGAAVESWTDEKGVIHMGNKGTAPAKDDPGAAVRNWMKANPGKKLPYTYSMG